jgi:hypothetical protein
LELSRRILGQAAAKLASLRLPQRNREEVSEGEGMARKMVWFWGGFFALFPSRPWFFFRFQVDFAHETLREKEKKISMIILSVVNYIKNCQIF